MRRQVMANMEPDFSVAQNYMEQRAREKQRQQEAFQKKVELSYDEKLLGAAVANVFASQLPEEKALETAKHPTPFTAVQAAFGKYDPRKETMARIRENYAEMLRTPEFAHMGPNETLNAATQATLRLTPSEKVPGGTLEDDIHRYHYRRADSGLWPDKNLVAMPGYEEWVENERAKPIEERQIGIGEGAAWGAGGYAAFKGMGKAIGGALVKRGVASGIGRVLIGQPFMPGKLLGAAVAGAAAVIPADALHNSIRKTDWFRAREDQPIARELMALLPEFGLGIAGGRAGIKAVKAAATKAVEKGVLSDALLRKFASKPTADAVMDLGIARRVEKTALKELEDNILYKATPQQKRRLFDHLEESGRDFREQYGREEVLRRDISGAATEMRNIFRFDENLPVPSPRMGRGRQLPGGGDGMPPTVPPRWQPDRNQRLYPETQQTARILPNRALPPGQGFGMGEPPIAQPPAGFGPTRQLPAAKIFGMYGDAKDVNSFSGRGGIYGLAFNDLPKPKRNASGQLLSIPARELRQAFNKLNPEETVAVTDMVLNSGKSLDEAVTGAIQVKNLQKGLADFEGTVFGLSGKPTTLPANAAYEGSSVVDGAKAAKVATLKQQVGPEVVGPTAQEAKAIKSTVADWTEGMTDQEWTTVGGQLLRRAGERTRGRVPAQARRESLFPDASKEAPELSSVKRGMMPEAEYVGKLRDPIYRNIELQRIYNDLKASGVSDARLDAHPAMKAFSQMQAKAVAAEAEAMRPAARNILNIDMDAPSLVGMTPKAENDFINTLLKMGVAGSAFGIIAMSDLFGASEAEAAVGGAAKTVTKTIGSELFEHIKGMPKAWFNTYQEYAALKNLSKDKKAVHGLLEKFVKDADEAGYTAHVVGDSKILPRRMVAPNFTEMAKEMYGKASNWIETAKKLPLGIERLMGAWGRGILHYKTGANPAVHLAAIQTAWTNNINNGMEVLTNIMRDVKGGASNMKAVSDAMAPLAEQYSGVVTARGAMLTKMKNLEKIEEKITKQLLNDKKMDPAVRAKVQDKIRRNRETLAKYKQAMETKVEPEYQEFLRQHDAVSRDLAKKFPSTRVFLAANDTEEFARYPWLKGMLTYEERQASTHIKAMMKHYEEESIKHGLNTISDGPFMHYSWHQKWNDAAAEKYAKMIGIDLEVQTVPFNKFHHRTQGAVPMMPDVWHSVQSYIPIAEKTLGWTKFWDKKNPNGWARHMRSGTVQQSDAMRAFWNSIVDASRPMQQTQVDKYLERYFNFEVFRLLGFSPSVAYKHFFKNIGTWGSLGFMEAASHFGTAARTAARIKLNSPEGRKWVSKLGFDPNKLNKKFYDDAAKSYTLQAKNMNLLDTQDLLPPSQLNWFDNMLTNINAKAGFQVAAVESYDRVHSFLAAAEMGMKRGMTARDASYAIFDTILKNNFLSGVVNPSWAKSPKVRALLLFQTTAFKIFERRIITGIQSKRAVTEVFKELKKDKTPWTWDRIQSEAQAIRRFITAGEFEFKKSIITDALASQRDFMGQFSVRQAMRETLYAGMVLGGGAALGHDYAHHLHHAPFLSGRHDDPTLAMSPITKGLHMTIKGKPYGGEFSEFGIVGDFLNNWLQGQAPIPQMVVKGMRIANDDIPDIYAEEGIPGRAFRYLWAIPSPKEKSGESGTILPRF